jgi:predicted ABC-type sugar transport system permease subunit
VARANLSRAYDAVVVGAGSSGVMNGVLLASAIVPPLVVVALAWFFLRAGRRHDARERGERRSIG